MDGIEERWKLRMALWGQTCKLKKQRANSEQMSRIWSSQPPSESSNRACQANTIPYLPPSRINEDH